MFKLLVATELLARLLKSSFLGWGIGFDKEEVVIIAWSSVLIADNRLFLLSTLLLGFHTNGVEPELDLSVENARASKFNRSCNSEFIGSKIDFDIEEVFIWSKGFSSEVVNLDLIGLIRSDWSRGIRSELLTFWIDGYIF